MTLDQVPDTIEGLPVIHAEIIQLPAHSYAIVMLETPEHIYSIATCYRGGGYRRYSDEYTFQFFGDATDFFDTMVANARAR